MFNFRNILVKVEKFSVWYAVAQVIGLLTLMMMLAWCVYYQGGMAWRWSPYERNVHPFMMTLGFIYLMGNSLMIYRGFKQFSKLTLKQMHATLHIVALVAVIIGLTAMWDYKNYESRLIFGVSTNLKSLHSWLGLTTLILFVIQWCYSFMVFLYPGAALHVRTKFMNPHVFIGLTIFMLATVSAITGIFQESTWSRYKTGQVYANVMGLFLCLFVGLVVYIVTKPQFKRLDYHV